MKQAIRQRIIADRQQMAEHERARLSRAIAARIAGLNVFRAAGAVLAYMNFGAEFAAEELAQLALEQGKQVLLPRVNKASNKLDVYRVTDLQHDLAPGMWGIREPVAERCVRLDALDTVDFILLPGVAFGRDGARLGYGGGFYDKLLARLTHRPALVAGAYALQVIDGIPQEATDRKVEWLVTENETIHCSGAD